MEDFYIKLMGCLLYILGGKKSGSGSSKVIQLQKDHSRSFVVPLSAANIEEEIMKRAGAVQKDKVKSKMNFL